MPYHVFVAVSIFFALATEYYNPYLWASYFKVFQLVTGTEESSFRNVKISLITPVVVGTFQPLTAPLI